MINFDLTKDETTSWFVSEYYLSTTENLIVILQGYSDNYITSTIRISMNITVDNPLKLLVFSDIEVNDYLDEIKLNITENKYELLEGINFAAKEQGGKE